MEFEDEDDDDEIPRADAAAEEDKRSARTQLNRLSALNGYPDPFSVFAGETLTLRLARKPGSRRWGRKAHVTKVDIRDAVSGAVIATVKPPGKIAVEEQEPANYRDEGAAYRCALPLDTSGWPVGVYECVVHDSTDGASEGIFANVKPAAFDDYDLVCVLPFFTWHAYNRLGGGSYYSNSIGPMRTITTQRPLYHKGDNAIEASLVFLEAFAGDGIRYCCVDSWDLHRGTLPEDRVPVMALLTHDEYWSEEMRSQVNKHLRRHGALLVAAGNVCWWQITIDGNNLSVDKAHSPKRAIWHRHGYPEERTFLSSFRFGGYAVGHAQRKKAILPRIAHLSEAEIRDAGALTIVKPRHPIFKGVTLGPGDTFGAEVPIVYREVDGIPLKEDGNVDRDWYDADDVDPEIIATGLTVSTYRYNPVVRIGVVAEGHVRRGHVLHLGSFGWSRGLSQKNEAVKRIVLNAVRYCLSMAHPRKGGRAKA